MNDELFRMMSFFHPQKMFDNSSRLAMPNLGPLIDRLPRMYDRENVQILDNEWRYLDSIDVPSYYKEQDVGVVYFFTRLALFKQFDSFPFKNLCTFIQQMLSLPVSNADAERFFSKMNLIKTNRRNRLEVSSLKSLVYISEAVKDQVSCYQFKPSQAMLDCLPK